MKHLLPVLRLLWLLMTYLFRLSHNCSLHLCAEWDGWVGCKWDWLRQKLPGLHFVPSPTLHTRCCLFIQVHLNICSFCHKHWALIWSNSFSNFDEQLAEELSLPLEESCNRKQFGQLDSELNTGNAVDTDQLLPLWYVRMLDRSFGPSL